MGQFGNLTNDDCKMPSRSPVPTIVKSNDASNKTRKFLTRTET